MYIIGILSHVLQCHIGVFSRLVEGNLSLTMHVLNLIVHRKNRLCTLACCRQVKADVISYMLQRRISVKYSFMYRILHFKNCLGTLTGKCLGSGKD